MKYKPKCYHCKQQVFDTMPSLKYFAENGRDIVGGAGLKKRLFCNDECCRNYLSDALVEKYNGYSIYLLMTDGLRLYLPYLTSAYGFRNVEDCRMRLDNSSSPYVDEQAFRRMMASGEL